MSDRKLSKKAINKKRRRISYECKKLWECFRSRWEKETGGFTYVETVAVIAIGAILTAGSVFSASKIISAARKTAARTQIEQFSSALQIYFLDCGRFPTTEQGLAALWQKPVLYPIPENWNGPYLDREPGNDPWGADFEYLSSESSIMPAEVPESLPFILISYGPDGCQGGKEKGGESDDICSWK